MERDFLGVNGRDSCPAALKEDTRGSRQDADHFGGLAVHWPFSNKVAAMQPFMLYKAAQEEKARSYVFDKHPSLRFQPMPSVGAFEANQRASHALSAQKCLGLDGQGLNHYLMHTYQHQSTGSFDAVRHQMNEARTPLVVPHHIIPVNMGNPFFKVQNAHSGPFGGGIAVNNPVGGPAVGAFAPRNMPKPSHMSAQLTIFYGGCVNVYDDVSLDKAQAIMLLAGKRSSSTSNAINPRSEAPLPTAAPVPAKVAGPNGISIKQTLIPTPVCVVSACSGHSNPISHTLDAGASAGSGSSNNDVTTRPKAVGPVVPTKQQEMSKTSTAALGSGTVASNTPRAIPQARKASLARFLEKRKERMTNVMPYACSKINPENGTSFDCGNLSSISSSVDINLSSYREDSWFVADPKGGIDSVESLSTKLAI